MCQILVFNMIVKVTYALILRNQYEPLNILFSSYDELGTKIIEGVWRIDLFMFAVLLFVDFSHVQLNSES